MKITKLYTGEDNQSHFMEMDAGFENKHPLGDHSQVYPVKGMLFRDFEKDAVYDWHNAPQEQYIIYLEGEVEIEIANGEKRKFLAGEVLLAADLTGKGHITRTLTKGRSLIVTVG